MMPQDIPPRSLARDKNPLREWLRRVRHAFSQKGFFPSFVLSMLFVAIGFGVNLFAIQYATLSVSNSVTDIVLSNVPIFDIDGLFVYGTFLLIASVVIVLISHPKRIPFALYALGLFWIIRGGFTSLTHIAPYPTGMVSDFGTFITHLFLAGGDEFFSGHTGAPFLFALMFWRQPVLRTVFLLWSIFFGVVVLLAHLHYSIDVASAFFITYGVFYMAVWLFAPSWRLFCSDNEPDPAL
jgi:membrane-associated phospholipid phosphatase